MEYQLSEIDWSKSGDWPKRKRGYHRALKRKEPWALYRKKEPLSFFLKCEYMPSILETGFNSSAIFLKQTDDGQIWKSGAVIPFKIEEEDYT